MKCRRFALIAAILFTLVILISLVLLAPSMHPIRRTTVAEFWSTFTGTEIGGARPSFFGGLALHNGRFVYTTPGMDDIWLAWIPETEAMASWPAGEAALEKLTATAPDGPRAIGYGRWKAVPPAQQMGLVGLSRAISQATSERVYRENPDRLPVGDVFSGDIQTAESCAEKMDWYWATFAFEFFFLGGLIWWILWPAIRGSGVTRYIVHWTAAPTLFLLPTWLGYSIRIGGVTQYGGILYSWILFYLGSPARNERWEIAFLSRLPPVLEPLCQHARLDPWSGGLGAFLTIHGPISAMSASGVVLVLLSFGAILHKFVLIPWREKHRPQGFEVVPISPGGVTAATPAANTTAESSPPAPAPARQES